MTGEEIVEQVLRRDFKNEKKKKGLSQRFEVKNFCRSTQLP